MKGLEKYYMDVHTVRYQIILRRKGWACRARGSSFYAFQSSSVWHLSAHLYHDLAASCDFSALNLAHVM